MNVRAPRDIGTHQGWVAALDDLELVLQRQTAALEDGLHDGHIGDELMFGFPDISSPLPAELQDRASRLLAANNALVERVRQRSEEVQPREHVRYPRPQGRPMQSHFDHRA